MEKGKFEVGKWYKWRQVCYKKHHYGKFKEYSGDYFYMEPWIINCNEYCSSGTFVLSEASEIEEISENDVSYVLPSTNETAFKRDFYVKVNSSEEATRFLDYLEKQGEPVFRNIFYTTSWCYIVFIDGVHNKGKSRCEKWSIATEGSIGDKREVEISEFVLSKSNKNTFNKKGEKKKINVELISVPKI